MKRLFPTLFLLCGCLAVAPATLAAEIRYAKPALETPVRAEGSLKGKILYNLDLSEPVELLNSTGDWSRVKTADGTVGWVRTRNLGASPVVPTELFQPGTPGGRVLSDAEGAFRDLNEANSQLKQELASCTTDRNTLEDKYTTLTSDPESIVHTRNALDEARARVKHLEEQLSRLEIDHKALKMNRDIMWVAVGCGIMMLGWLIGRFTGAGGRKKRNSLY